MSTGRVDGERSPLPVGALPTAGSRPERQQLVAELARLEEAYERALRVGARASDPGAASQAYDETDRLQDLLLQTLMRLRRCAADEVEPADSAGVVEHFERRGIQPPPEAA